VPFLRGDRVGGQDRPFDRAAVLPEGALPSLREHPVFDPVGDLQADGAAHRQK
jgi:hypothetical protein